MTSSVTPSRPNLIAALPLKPCPHCGNSLQIRRGVNGYGRCVTENCFGARMPVVSFADPQMVEEWNTRAALASEPEPQRVVEGRFVIGEKVTASPQNFSWIIAAIDGDIALLRSPERSSHRSAWLCEMKKEAR